MKRLIIFLLIFSSVTSFAQTAAFKGRIMDTTEKRPLHNAVVSLISKKDSSLYAFKRTDPQGYFNFGNVAAGKYILLVSYPGFADLSDEYEITDNTDLGAIALTPKSALLDEVIVRSGQAIRIKGDTTEFTADSFMVKEGATVEDLMKKLPGFQVNSKGEITAQGKRVDKVLVDGEEFFGDDPTMATQNISSKAVDKVQVFDTKTEQQDLTGITSGSEGKTINIKLKESHKKGSFGKAHAGSDFSDYMDVKALYNQFVGKKKVSLYGTKSNLNTGSLNWEERQKLGMDENMEYDDISGFYYNFGSDDGFNDWSLRGLPDSYTAGGLYSNKFNEEKQSLNLSYRYNRLGTENNGYSRAQIIGEKGINFRNSFTNTNGRNEQHAVNGKFEWKLDSLASLKLVSSGLRKVTSGSSHIESEFLDSARGKINTTDQTRFNDAVKLQYDNVLTYRQMFNKRNRLLISTFRFGLIDDDQEGTNNSLTEVYRNNGTGIDTTSTIIDQMKKFDGNSQTISGKVTYNEPLSDKLNVVVDYSYNTNHSTSFRNSFNKSSTGKYEIPDPVHSNNFDMRANSQSGMALLKYVGKKARYSFGSGVSNLKLHLKDLGTGTVNDYDFLKLTPQAQFNYTFKPQQSISFNYRGTTRQPSINQLQPLRDNTDPQYVFVGNPDLKMGFDHRLSANFFEGKVLARRHLWMSVSYSMTNNAIVNSTTIDRSTGFQKYTPVNVNGVRNWWMNGNWNKGGGEGKPSFGISLNGNGGRNISFIDEGTGMKKNINNYQSVRLGPSMYIDKPEKFSIELRPEIGHTSSKSSLRPQQDNNYFTYGGWLNGFVMLPGKIEFRNDLNFDLRQKTETFSNNTNIINWNAYIAKKVFKDKSGKIFLMTNDILAQNKGFNRFNNSTGGVTEEGYSRVGQYMMLKFEWSFNKMPGATK